MSRPSTWLSLALSLLAALLVGLAPASALDPAFTTFEGPDTTLVLSNCQNDEVRARMRELDAAVRRLDLKLDRIGKAMQDALATAGAARDPAVRRAALNDYIALLHWRDQWNGYRRLLERQIVYYNSLPPCGQRRRDRGVEFQPAPMPVAIGPFAPVVAPAGCSPDAEAAVRDLVEDNRAAARRVEAARAEAEEKARALAELEARGEGNSHKAKQLRDELAAKLQEAAAAEDTIRIQNKVIQEELERRGCPPAADNRHGALPVPMGRCEAGVLAAVNAARADPSGYGRSLRGARGRYADEARAFLASRAPVSALTADPRLMAAARDHGEDLARRNVVEHRGSDGRGLMDRFRAQGLFVTLSAEVIAVRQPTPAGALRALVIDEGHPGGPHRKDLFNPLFTMTGIACVQTRSHGQVVVIDLSNAPMS